MEEVRRMRPLLGTYVEVCARAMSATAAQAALEAAFAALALAQQRWSRHDPASELSLLNRQRCARPAPDTLRLLALARAMTAASAGAFDCTLGTGTPADIDLRADEVRLGAAARLCLDGIAKGYAVDLAVRALRRAGAAGGWINAGGDLRVYGAASLPLLRRELDGAIRPLGRIQGAAVASSRVNDRDDGLPAAILGRSHKGVYTVLARSAWRADALTKVAANTHADARADAVARLGGLLVEAA